MRRRQVLRAGAAAAGTAFAGRAAAAPGTTTGTDALGRVSLPGTTDVVVGPGEDYAAVAVGDGFALVDVSAPASPRVVVERRDVLADHDRGPMRQVHDVAVDGDRLLAVGPAHATTGLRAAVLYDVSDPAAPRRLAVHETPYPIHNADLADGVAYLTANDMDRNPLVAVDVTADPPRERWRWSLPGHDDAWADVPAQLRVVHDVRVRGGVAAVAYWDGGTWLLDVAGEGPPSVRGHAPHRSPSVLAGLTGEAVGAEAVQLPGNDHYAERSPDGTLLAVGREAWDDAPGDGFAGGPGGVDVYDLTGSSPTHLSRVAPPPTPDATLDGRWTTAHNLDLRDDRLYASWYDGGVSVHDLSDPAAPTTLARWTDPGASVWAARRAGDCVVASAFERDGTDPALYTLPVPESPTGTTSAPDGIPGFGVAAALVGGAIAAWRTR